MACKYYVRPGTDEPYMVPGGNPPASYEGYVKPGWDCTNIDNGTSANVIGLGWVQGRRMQPNAMVKRFRRFRR